MAALDLTQGPVVKTLLRLMYPLLAGFAAMMFVGVYHSWLLGQYGEAELAAFGYIFPFYGAIISFHVGLLIAASALTARAVGEKQSPEVLTQLAGKAFLVGLILMALVLAFVLLSFPLLAKWQGIPPNIQFIIKQYFYVWLIAMYLTSLIMIANGVFRAYGDTKTPSYLLLFSAFLNIISAPLLIFGKLGFPPLGIQGSAWTTFLSAGVSAVFSLSLLRKRKMLVWPSLRFSQMKHELSIFLKITLSCSLINLIWSFATYVNTMILSAYGEHAVAAYGVGIRIEQFIFIPVMALTAAMSPFVSQNYGAGNYARIQEAHRFALRYGWVWGASVALLAALLAEWLKVQFSADPLVQDLIVAFLWIVPLSYIFESMNFFSPTIFTALHQPRFANYLLLIQYLGVMVPATLLLGYFYGAKGVFVGISAANTLSGLVLSGWLAKRILKRFYTQSM